MIRQKIDKKLIPIVTRYAPAALSGVLMTLSFPDANLGVFIFFALAPLLIYIKDMTTRQAFFAGFTTGVVHFSTLIYWLVTTLSIYGKLHPALSCVILSLLTVYLAVYPALFCFILKKINPGPIFLPIFAAIIWTSLEYIRTHAFTGFSWGLLGYSQHENITFIQMADLVGVYGISFLIVMVNGVVSLFWEKVKNSQKTPLATPFAYTIIFVVGAYLYGDLRIKQLQSIIKESPTATIGVVQGNIRQDKKWDETVKKQTVETYRTLSASLKSENPDLIIWPETAMPFFFQLNSGLTQQVNKTIRSIKSHFLIGSPAFSREKNNISYYNRAYMIDPSAQITGSYDKHHLVPFGEYVPLANFLTFLGKITAQAGDFSPGKDPLIPLAFKDYHMGVLICFEILFPSIASDFVQNGATFLTTMTNDAWFGRTSAARQHFSIAVFRAIENRRTLIRAANTGISGIIDPTGRILKQTPLFSETAFIRHVPALSISSIYSRHTDLFAKATLVAFFLIFMLKRLKSLSKKNDQGDIK